MRELVLTQIATALLLHFLTCTWTVRANCHPQQPLLSIKEVVDDDGVENQISGIFGIYPRVSRPVAISMGLAMPTMLLTSAAVCTSIWLKSAMWTTPPQYRTLAQAVDEAAAKSLQVMWPFFAKGDFLYFCDEESRTVKLVREDGSPSDAIARNVDYWNWRSGLGPRPPV